jgi:hypothetical protein
VFNLNDGYIESDCYIAATNWGLGALRPVEVMCLDVNQVKDYMFDFN